MLQVEAARVNLLLPHLDCETKHISLRCCIHMTASHCSRCWNTSFIYKVVLLYEYEVGDVCLNCNIQHDPSESPRESPTATTEAVRPSISSWSCVPMTTGHNSRCWNTLYMYEDDREKIHQVRMKSTSLPWIHYFFMYSLFIHANLLLWYYVKWTMIMNL